MSRCANYEAETYTFICIYLDLFYTRSSHCHSLPFHVCNTSLEPFRLVHMMNGNYYYSLLAGELFDFLREI